MVAEVEFPASNHAILPKSVVQPGAVMKMAKSSSAISIPAEIIAYMITSAPQTVIVSFF